MSQSNTRTFAIIAGEDVVATIVVPQTSPNSDMLWAALSSSPQIVESTSTEDVGLGWKYSDGIFTRES